MINLLKFISKAVLSIFLILLGIFIFKHQSSAAFELGMFCIFSGVFHWLLWPSN